MTGTATGSELSAHAAAFQRCVVNVLSAQIAASAGWCVLRHLASDPIALVDEVSAGEGQALTGILRAVLRSGMSSAAVVLGSDLPELLPSARLQEVEPTRTAGRHRLIVWLGDDRDLYGVAALERPRSGAEFSAADCDRLRPLLPLISAGARAQIAALNLECEAIAGRALGSEAGTVLLLDTERRRIVWSNDERWQQRAEEPRLVSGLFGTLDRLGADAGEVTVAPPAAARSSRTTLVCRPAGPSLVVVQLSRLPELSPDLSPREHTVAKLLLEGYGGVNVAAITGLSENTVRTYIRRVYRKLGVRNRADFVRRMLSNHPEYTRSAAC